MKLIWIVVLAIIAWRIVTGDWPWKYLGRMRHRESLAEARKVLDVRPGATRQQILEAHRRRLALVHPDRGGSNEAVHQVNAARDALLAELSQHVEEQS